MSKTKKMEKEQEPEQPPLDQTLIEAINNGTIRDKQILLAAESEMGRFIASNLQRQPLSSALSSSLNSYQRMLVHRLGDSFGVNRIFDSGQMFIERTESTAWPTVRLETLIAKQKPTTPSTSNPSAISTASIEKTDPTLTSSSPSSSSSPSLPAPTQPNSTTNLPPPKAFKIMSRTLSQSSRPSNRSLMPSTASSGSSNDCSLSESRRNEMSYEERQAAYLEARNRIFANSSNNSVENSAGASTAGSTSSSSAGASPEDDRLSITTSTSKKSKALSDPPVESGSNSVELNNNSSQPKIKDSKSDSSSRTSNKKLSAKLRPSATSFDPSAKAHGYEEVTIIEVDDQSITVPYQDFNLYNPYLASNHHHHPPAYPNGFLRDPRFGPAPPTNNQNYNGFPTPSYPINNRSHQNLACRNNPANFSAPNNNNNNSGMAPALVHPPYQPPQAQTGTEHNSMPTMIGTVPLPPISPHVQTNGSTSNRPQSFPARAPEVGYNSLVVHPPPPLAGDPSLQYPPSFLPRPPPQQQQQQQQQQQPPHPHPPHLNHNHHQPNGQSNGFHSEPNGFHSPDLNHHHQQQQQRQLPPHSTQGYHPNHPRLAHPPVDPVTGYAWATPLPPLLPPQTQQFRENGQDQAPGVVHPPFPSAVRPAGASPDVAHRPPTNGYVPPTSCAELGPPHQPHSSVSSSNTTAPLDPPSDHKIDALSGSFSTLHLHAHPPPHPHPHHHHHHHHHPTTPQHRIHSTRRAAAAPPLNHSLDNHNHSTAVSRPHRLLPLDRPSSLVSSSPLHPLPLKPRWNFLPSSASSDLLFSPSPSPSSPCSDPPLSASVATVTSSSSS